MKNTLTLLALAVATLLTVASTGCVSSDSAVRDIARDTAFELVTKVATSEALKSDIDRAETVILVTGLVLDGITSDELTLPAAVDAAVKDLVLASDLSPGSKQAVLVLADSIKSRYLARIEAGQLDPRVTAPLSTIIGWVKSAAEDTLRYGAPQSYGLPALTAEDIPPMRRRQDLIGWIFNLKEPNPAFTEKWGPGLRDAVIIGEE